MYDGWRRKDEVTSNRKDHYGQKGAISGGKIMPRSLDGWGEETEEKEGCFVKKGRRN